MASRFTKDYFDGYKFIEVPKKNGKGTRRVMEYIGEWYGIKCSSKEHKRFKIWAACLSVVALTVYLLCVLSRASVNMHQYAALPAALILLPMLFLFMGVVSFLIAKEKWERRVYHSGYRRMYRGAIGNTALFGLSFIVGAVYTIISDSPAELIDYGYLAGMLIGTACSAALLAMIRAKPAKVVQAGTKE